MTIKGRSALSATTRVCMCMRTFVYSVCVSASNCINTGSYVCFTLRVEHRSSRRGHREYGGFARLKGARVHNQNE